VLDLDASGWELVVTSEQTNRDMLRVRDAIDRDYGSELDVGTLAKLANVSPAHLIRTFRSVFAETPHRYLQRRRIERSMFLLRSTSESVTDICMAVGFTSLGTFSRTFTDIVGEPPSRYRRRGPLPPAAGCFTMAWTRPSSFGDGRDDRAISEKHRSPDDP
jgi:AraC-like DNA-binding protein